MNRFICLKEGRDQYAGWLYDMLVILHDMIKEHQSCKSNAPLHMKQDANSLDKWTHIWTTPHETRC